MLLLLLMLLMLLLGRHRFLLLRWRKLLRGLSSSGRRMLLLDNFRRKLHHLALLATFCLWNLLSNVNCLLGFLLLLGSHHHHVERLWSINIIIGVSFCCLLLYSLISELKLTIVLLMLLCGRL
jgi:hypothetical protein